MIRPRRGDCPWAAQPVWRQDPGGRTGKMVANQGLCLWPEMPNRVTGYISRDQMAPEPQEEAILEWGDGGKGQRRK